MPKQIEQILEAEEVTHIAQFTQEDKDWINSRIHDRADGEPGVECIIRGKNDNGDYFKLTPEEINAIEISAEEYMEKAIIHKAGVWY